MDKIINSKTEEIIDRKISISGNLVLLILETGPRGGQTIKSEYWDRQWDYVYVKNHRHMEAAWKRFNRVPAAEILTDQEEGES